MFDCRNAVGIVSLLICTYKELQNRDAPQTPKEQELTLGTIFILRSGFSCPC